MNSESLVRQWKSQLSVTSEALNNPAGFIEITDYDLDAAGGQVIVNQLGTDTCAVCCRGGGSCCCGGTCGCPA
jgi:hypothetical protein